MKAVLSALAVTGSSALLTMLLGAITTKIIAVASGPAGIGAFAQLRQIIQWFVTLATLNGQNSLVRGIASKDKYEQARFLGVVGVVYLIGSISASSIVLVFAPPIAEIVFGSQDEALIFAVRLGAIPILLGTVAGWILGVINGYREIRALAIIQIMGSVVTAAVAFPLVQFHHPAAYVGIVSAGFLTVALLGGWWLLQRDIATNWRQQNAVSISSVVKDHVTYSAATLATGLCGAGAVVVLRALYIRAGGLETGGYFDAAWTISMMYVMLILSSFSTYYFPTLSSKTTTAEINDCVNQVLHVAILLGTVLITFVIAVKPLLISVLYSGHFQPATKILRWMLIGDYLKISGWVFGMLLLAFAERRRFLMTELLWQAAMVISVAAMVGQTTDIAGISFLVANAFYLFYVWRHATKRYGVKVSTRLRMHWILGLCVVCGLSALTWQQDTTDMYFAVIVWLCAIVLFTIGATNNEERRAVAAWLFSRSRE